MVILYYLCLNCPPLAASRDLHVTYHVIKLMASQAGKAELPTLGGTRIKTRKRDEKVKYDPTTFCEQVILGLNATGGGLEEVSKYLDQGGDQLNYRCGRGGGGTPCCQCSERELSFRLHF